MLQNGAINYILYKYNILFISSNPLKMKYL